LGGINTVRWYLTARYTMSELKQTVNARTTITNFSSLFSTKKLLACWTKISVFTRETPAENSQDSFSS
jgi:hypothetical protein